MNKVRVMGTTFIAALIGLFFLFCVGWALYDYYGEKSSDIELEEAKPSERNAPKEFTLVALGDSLTRGTGDETGKGYVGLVVEELEERFKSKPLVHNLGVKGQVSKELAKQVKQVEIKRQIQSADVILITIGGNDLFQQGQTLYDYDFAVTSELQEEYLKNLNLILKEITTSNNSATIFMIGLYNPFIELDEDYDTNKIVRDWNAVTADVIATYENAVFVPTFDLFQLSVNEYLYSDKFHPNKEGYRLIAERVSPLIQWEGDAK
ncbi:GDSL-type esterase/lipase family protein [Peribacillus sp. NPDC097295]|uniref:GDSL-type esterase/lipase family protein n=1 Tax=Peribacillus sp. NPDC097295 TaxID=3364402 RepID=UPI00380EF961